MFFVCWFSMLLSQPLWRISSMHRNYKQLKSSNKSTTKTKQKATLFLFFKYHHRLFMYPCNGSTRNKKKTKENQRKRTTKRKWKTILMILHTRSKHGQRKRAGMDFFFPYCWPLRWSMIRHAFKSIHFPGACRMQMRTKHSLGGKQAQTKARVKRRHTHQLFHLLSQK